jgi:hypothetical protein
MLAALIGEDAQEMQAISVARIARENVAIEPLSFGELAALMVTQRFGESVGRARRIFGAALFLRQAAFDPAHRLRPRRRLTGIVVLYYWRKRARRSAQIISNDATKRQRRAFVGCARNNAQNAAQASFVKTPTEF